MLALLACTTPMPSTEDPSASATAAGADWVDRGEPFTAVAAWKQGEHWEAWATTGAGSLVRSVATEDEDLGDTWEVVAPGDRWAALTAVAPAPGGAWAVGRAGRLVRAVDGKVDEDQIGSVDLEDLVVLPGDGPNFGAIAVGAAGTVLRTEDGGETWTSLRLPDVGALSAVAARKQGATWEVWATGSPGSLFVSRDDGRSWEAAPTAERPDDLLALSLGTNGGWAVGSRGRVMELAAEGWRDAGFSGGQARLYDVLAAGDLPFGALDVVVAGHGGGIWARERQGGWQDMPWAGERPFNAWTGLVSAGRTLLAVGDEGAVARSRLGEGLPQWTLQRAGWRPSLYAVATASDGGAREVVAVGRSGTIFRRIGSSWRLEDAGVRTNLRGVDLAAPGNGWAVGLDGVVLRLDSSGWSRIDLPDGTGEPLLASVVADGTSAAWALLADGRLVRLADLVAPRIVQPIAEGRRLNLGPASTVCMTDAAVLVGASTGVWRYTTDDGAWSPEPVVSGPVSALACARDGRVRALMDTPGPSWALVGSHDDGATWTTLGAGDGRLFGFDDLFDGRRGVAVGGSGTAIETTDGWQTWRSVLTRSAEAWHGNSVIPLVRDVALDADGTAWIVGDGLAMAHGRVGDPLEPWRNVAPSFHSVVDAGGQVLVVTDANWLLVSTDQGRSWSPQAACGSATAIRGAAPIGNGAVFVGDHGQVTVRDAEGRCQDRGLRADVGLTAVTAARGEVWVVGDGAAVFRGAVGALEPVPWREAPGEVTLRAVWSDGDRTLVVGDEGVLGRWDPHEERLVRVEESGSGDERPVVEDLLAITEHEGSFFVVGDHGTLLFSPDGETWERRRLPVTDDLHAIRFNGASGWIVGDHGTILETRDGGATWESLATDVQADLRAIAVGGTLLGGGVVVGEGGTLLQAQAVRPPPAVVAAKVSRDLASVTMDIELDHAGADVSYRLRAVEARLAGGSWTSISKYDAVATTGGYQLVWTGFDIPTVFESGDEVRWRLTLSDGRRSWRVGVPASTSWLDAWAVVPSPVQYALGLLVPPALGLVLAWIFFPGLFLLGAVAEEEPFLLTGLRGAARFFSAIGPVVDTVAALVGPIQRSRRVRRVWLAGYGNGGKRRYCLGSVYASTVVAYAEDPDVQAALIHRYRSAALEELARGLGMTPAELLRPPAVVTARGIREGHLALFEGPALRAGVAHVQATLTEGATEYLYEVARVASEPNAQDGGALPVLLEEGDTDVIQAVVARLQGLMDEEDRDGVTPELAQELLDQGRLLLAIRCPSLPPALGRALREARRGSRRSLFLLATAELDQLKVDTAVVPGPWPLERAFHDAGDRVWPLDPRLRELAKGRATAALTGVLGADPAALALPPELVFEVLRRSTIDEPAEDLVADAVSAWLLHCLRPPSTEWEATVAGIRALARLATVDGTRPPGTFDAPENGPGAAVLPTAAKAGVVVEHMLRGRFSWAFRHDAVARWLGGGGGR